MKMRRAKTDNIAEVTFNSIADIPTWIDAHPREMRCADSETLESNEEWDFNTNYPASIAMAKRGGDWAEGGRNLKKVALKMADLVTMGRVPGLDTDVAGFLPDVPAYLAGDPCNMWTDAEEEVAQAPIITVGVNVATSAGCDASERFNYGAAIMSVVDELENKGARVELWAVSACSTSSGGVEYRTLLKAADQHWSPRSVAFALCHAAFNRRLMFRIGESFAHIEKFVATFGKPHDMDCFDVWFPGLLFTNSAWAKDPETALQYTTTLAQRQLTQGDTEWEAPKAPKAAHRKAPRRRRRRQYA